jgi:hypothetical protein
VIPSRPRHLLARVALPGIGRGGDGDTSANMTSRPGISWDTP